MMSKEQTKKTKGKVINKLTLITSLDLFCSKTKTEGIRFGTARQNSASLYISNERAEIAPLMI